GAQPGHPGRTGRRPRPDQTLPRTVVGFAAETGDEHGSVLDYGRAKLVKKGCEMLVVNEVGQSKTFGAETNEATILFADGREAVSTAGSKLEVARRVIEQLAGAI
ncbi:phosphopantothenoylcysteine decarboxylase, partial [Arthrobacter sp. JCM 19049]|uniref:phosphopantothenoylcysteine decarboxylase domain-containing protein n=1 Tax=Arthrobacter sp. JCM 19049 TaxID=1460643 RepID=UPI002436AD16